MGPNPARLQGHLLRSDHYAHTQHTRALHSLVPAIPNWNPEEGEEEGKRRRRRKTLVGAFRRDRLHTADCGRRSGRSLDARCSSKETLLTADVQATGRGEIRRRRLGRRAHPGLVLLLASAAQHITRNFKIRREKKGEIKDHLIPHIRNKRGPPLHSFIPAGRAGHCGCNSFIRNVKNDEIYGLRQNREKKNGEARRIYKRSFSLFLSLSLFSKRSESLMGIREPLRIDPCVFFY